MFFLAAKEKALKQQKVCMQYSLVRGKTPLYQLNVNEWLWKLKHLNLAKVIF